MLYKAQNAVYHGTKCRDDIFISSHIICPVVRKPGGSEILHCKVAIRYRYYSIHNNGILFSRIITITVFCPVQISLIRDKIPYINDAIRANNSLSYNGILKRENGDFSLSEKQACFSVCRCPLLFVTAYR